MHPKPNRWLGHLITGTDRGSFKPGYTGKLCYEGPDDESPPSP